MEPLAADLALLRRFEPVVRYTEGELFLPAAVEDYVGHCGLWRHEPDGSSHQVVAPGALDLARLTTAGREHPGPGLWLRLVDHPFGRRQILAWRRRDDRPSFHGARRLAQVGVLSRMIDAANRLGLAFRGKVATGTQAAAETMYRDHRRAGVHPYYGRVLTHGGYTVLQYWFFYFFNDWRSRVYGVNDHEGDWEQVTLFLAEDPGGDLAPRWVAYSAHDEVGDDLRRRWDDPDVAKVGEHPVVFAGLGSHSGAYLPGEYLITFDPPALRGAVRLSRWVSRWFLPWTRHAPRQGVGIPYVDYHRGDGEGIGPGEAAEWAPVLVDDDTPWVREYSGLWGADTRDPFGGERGPAGPRYERTTRVRDSWGDPVGWTGLDKVSPNEAVARVAVRARLEELEAELVGLDRDVDLERGRMRASTAVGALVPPTEEAALRQTGRRRVVVEDEVAGLHRVLERPILAAEPHDHLRHRALPLTAASTQRRRVLALWSAISTSLVLVTLALLVLPIDPSVTAVSVIGLIVLFALEAFARGQLARFTASAIVTVIVVSVSITIAIGVAVNWRVTIGVVLIAAAVLFLALNLVELTRT